MRLAPVAVKAVVVQCEPYRDRGEHTLVGLVTRRDRSIMHRRSGAIRPWARKQVTTPVGVLVVDDQRVFRHAAREVIEAASPEFVLLGEAASGEHALAAVDDLHPDLVLVGVRMAGMDGIETSKRLNASHPEAVVVLVTTDDPLNLPAEVGFCGAADLVRKQHIRPALLRRLWRIHGRRRR